MNNKDLIRQYADSGQRLNNYQYDRLDDNLKDTYLRKRLIAANQDLDDDFGALMNYEYFGAPDKWKPVLISHLLLLMDEFFSEEEYNYDDPDFSFRHGFVNPIITKLLKANQSSPKSDEYILALLKNERFYNNLNKRTMGKLLNRANSVETIFNAFGDKVKQYLDYYKNNSAKIASDISYSTNPLGYAKMFSSIWDEYINNLPLREKAYMVIQSPNPLELLQLIGDEAMEVFRGDDNLLLHALNNGSYPKKFKEILNKYNIPFSHINYYNQMSYE